MRKLKPVRVGLLGFGVVGSGIWKVLERNADEISRRAGREIRIDRIATRTPSKTNGIVSDSVKVGNDLAEVVNDPDIDIVVEVIGGSEAPLALIEQAIRNKKHVVTANKALLAEHGNEIFSLAGENGVMVAFEAAVAGGIPIIKTMREGLSANRIEWLAGIINGTSNFILSQMLSKGLSFDEALKQAQELGYAEADPTFDIQGVDAAHKLTLMAAIAFGINISFDKVYIEGIADIGAEDVRYASQLGYRIKHLGIAKARENGIELRVHPTLIQQSTLLANVENAMNAVLVRGDALGEVMAYGPGAGSEATASAVIADLVDVTRMHTTDPQNRVPHLAFQPDALADYPILSIDDTQSAFYLRLLVEDNYGVLAEITRVLADKKVSIESMIQEQIQDDNSQDTGRAHIIVVTHQVREGDLNEALAEIGKLPCVFGNAVKLRLEEI